MRRRSGYLRPCAADDGGIGLTKRRIHVIGLAVLLLMAALLAGCGSNRVAVAENGDGPKSKISGYYNPDQSVSGGKDMQYINLRDISIAKTQTDTVLTMVFKYGSFQMGTAEEATNGVPKYTTKWHPGLDRLEIDIVGLAYWDYRVYADEMQDTPIMGVFKQMPLNDDFTTRLFINLKDDVAYKMVEKDNTLMLYLRSIPEDEHTDYYAVVDAFEEYTDGEIPEDAGLSPTLCSDKSNVTMISEPFGTKEEAEKFKTDVLDPILANLKGKAATVVALKNNQLPEYDTQGVLQEYANTPVYRQDEVEKPGDVLVANGQLLCWRPDGKAYVYVTPFFLSTVEGGVVTTYQKIYMNEEGSSAPTQLTEFEYNSIIKAAFSDDGRYLAFLEEGERNRSLYIYDSQTKEVFTAADSGFGVDTADFAWGADDKAHSLYAITGEQEMLQLMEYELSDDDAPDKVETLVEESFNEGSVGFYGGKVYYSQSSDNAGKSGIFCLDPASMNITRLCDGTEFDLNRKTGMMAIVSQTADDENSSIVLKTYSATNGQEKVVAEDPAIGAWMWTSDGDTLYYTKYYQNTNSNPDDPTSYNYTQALYHYTPQSGESTLVADIVEADIAASNQDDEIILTYVYSESSQNRFVPVTYRIKP